MILPVARHDRSLTEDGVTEVAAGPTLFHFIDKTSYFLYLDDGLSYTDEDDHDGRRVELTAR
jgi:hypothetical protein